jgi:hypothetical protein
MPDLVGSSIFSFFAKCSTQKSELLLRVQEKSEETGAFTFIMTNTV